MKVKVKVIVFIALVFQVFQTEKTFSQSLLLRNVSIIDVTNGNVLKKQNVVIRGDSIEFIGAKVPRLKRKVQEINAKGKYLIPGLWDSHVHLTMVGESSIPLFTHSGVTQVRDMGGDYTKLKNWRNTTTGNYPFIKTAGPILESPRFMGLLNRLLGPDFSQTRIGIQHPDQIDRVVDSLKAIGVDFIKIRTASNDDIFKALAKACQEKNISITGHIAPNSLMSDIIESGISTIEHYDFLQLPTMKAEEREAALRSVEKNKPAFTPTLLAFRSSRLTPLAETVSLLNDSLDRINPDRKYLSPSLLEAWSIEVKLNAFESKMEWDILDKSFIPFASEIAKRTSVLAGTDVGVRGIVPGKSLHTELQLLVEKLGLDPLTALQAATINPSRELGVLNEYGTVEAGKKANLVLLNSNPLLNIQHTTDIYAVIKDGQYFGGAEREMLLNEVELNVKETRLKFKSESLDYLNKFMDSMKGK